jgi:SAM-dependent methyltransferase
MTATPPYEDITETTGVPLSREGAEMLYTRYALARDIAADRSVLELGCGAGVGFGLVGTKARLLIGADYSSALLENAQSHYGNRVPLTRLSAEALPFRAGALDVVIFFEASYYVPDMERALDEIRRVLAPGGTVLFANANPERPDFIRSPYSVHYHTADEFRTALGRRGFQVAVWGAFPVAPQNRRGLSRGVAAGLSQVRRAVEALGLVPKTLKGRARLKRLVYGRLVPTPPEIHDGFAPRHTLTPLGPGPARDCKVIYVRGDK